MSNNFTYTFYRLTDDPVEPAVYDPSPPSSPRRKSSPEKFPSPSRSELRPKVVSGNGVKASSPVWPEQSVFDAWRTTLRRSKDRAGTTLRRSKDRAGTTLRRSKDRVKEIFKRPSRGSFEGEIELTKTVNAHPPEIVIEWPSSDSKSETSWAERWRQRESGEITGPNDPRLLRWENRKPIQHEKSGKLFYDKWNWRPRKKFDPALYRLTPDLTDIEYEHGYNDNSVLSGLSNSRHQ